MTSEQVGALQARIAELEKKVEDLELQLAMCNYETAAWYEGHDDATEGFAQVWEAALTEPIPKPGAMREPFESLYRRTEALRKEKS